MPSQGQSVSIGYSAYNTTTGAYVIGDVANHTLRLNKNGTVAAPANSPTEDDATNAPGQYSLVATSGETAFPIVKLEGKSSTANVIIIPTTVGFEQLPTAAPNAANGLLTFGTGAGQINVDGAGNTASNVTKWLGTAVTAVTAGTPDVNVKNINNVVAATPGLTGGIVIAGSNAATTFTTLNVGTFNISGVSSVAYTAAIAAQIGTNLDTTISSRLSAAGYVSTLPANFSLLAIDGSGDVTYNNAAPPTTAAIASAVAAAILAVPGHLLATDASGNVSLSATTYNAIADALLDRSDAIETGITPRLAWRYSVAALAGVLSGAGTTTITIEGAGVATVRIVATVDALGNRSVVVLS